MLWLVGCLSALAVGVINIILTKKRGKRRVTDGEVTYVDTAAGTVRVKYRPTDNAPLCKESFGISDNRYPAVGQKVLVALTNADGAEPVPTLIRYNSMQRDRTIAGAEKAAFIIAGICLVMGIVSLL